MKAEIVIPTGWYRLLAGTRTRRKDMVFSLYDSDHYYRVSLRWKHPDIYTYGERILDDGSIWIRRR